MPGMLFLDAFALVVLHLECHLSDLGNRRIPREVVVKSGKRRPKLQLLWDVLGHCHSGALENCGLGVNEMAVSVTKWGFRRLRE